MPVTNTNLVQNVGQSHGGESNFSFKYMYMYSFKWLAGTLYMYEKW